MSDGIQEQWIRESFDRLWGEVREHTRILRGENGSVGLVARVRRIEELTGDVKASVAWIARWVVGGVLTAFGTLLWFVLSAYFSS